MKLLVTGDRNWDNYDIIFWALAELSKDTIVIEGGARGADIMVKECAEVLELTIVHMPADWDKYGRAAGPIRNQQMLNENPDIVYAFHNKIKKSKGTRDMCLRCIIAGKPVTLYSEHSNPKQLTAAEL